MGLLHHIVAAYHIHSVIVCPHPFAVGIVHGNACDVGSREQIVGIVSTVVSRHLHLIESESRISLVFWSQREQSVACCHPDVPVFVFHHLSEEFHRSDSRTVFVCEVGIGVEVVEVCRIAENTVSAISSAGDPYSSAPVHHNLGVYRLRGIKLLFGCRPFVVGCINDESFILSRRVGNPQVCIAVVEHRCYNLVPVAEVCDRSYQTVLSVVVVNGYTVFEFKYSVLVSSHYMTVVARVYGETQDVVEFYVIMFFYSFAVVELPCLVAWIVNLYCGRYIRVPFATVAGIQLVVLYGHESEDVIERSIWNDVLLYYRLCAVGSYGIRLQLLVLLVSPVAFVRLVVRIIPGVSVVGGNTDVVGMTEVNIVIAFLPACRVNEIIVNVSLIYSFTGLDINVITLYGAVRYILPHIESFPDISSAHVNLNQSEGSTKISKVSVGNNIIDGLVHSHCLVFISCNILHLSVIVEQVDISVVVCNGKLFDIAVPCYL